MRLKALWAAGVGGGTRVLTASPVPARQLMNSGKNFSRVEVELSWSEALRYCRLHHTDLADLQSMNSVRSVGALYSLTSSTHAWIGLFFDVRVQGLSWSSGSAFSAPVWSSLPVFKEGLCATLYSISVFPSLGAASCTAQKPFICYYGVAPVPFWACPSLGWGGGGVLQSKWGSVGGRGGGEDSRVFLRKLTSSLTPFAIVRSAALVSISFVPHSSDSIIREQVSIRGERK